MSGTARSRIEACRLAAAASIQTAAARRAARAAAATPFKRKGTPAVPPPAKKAKVHARRDVLDQILRAEDVVRLPLLVVAPMLATHMYTSFATNLVVPAMLFVDGALVVEKVAKEDWTAAKKM